MKFSQATSEANLELREKEIERIAAESMLEGGECYPFSEDNFYDAVNQLLSGVVDGYALRGKIIDYWKNSARVIAERNYKD